MNCILWGATGQAKVVRPILENDGHNIVGMFDNNPSVIPPFPDIPLYYGEEGFSRFYNKAEGPLGFLVTIGGIRGRARLSISQRLEEAGLKPLSAIHQSAYIADSAKLERGVQIMPMAAVSEYACIGAFTILNTNCTVDHECLIHQGCHVMPAAALAGEVELGEASVVGTNATILPRMKIGREAVVGAGAVVTRNVLDGVTVKGIPAR